MISTFSLGRFVLTLMAAILMTTIPVLAAEERAPGYHFGLGPFEVRSQSPVQSLRLGLPPMLPGKIEPGRFQSNLSGTWTNVWAKDDRYFLDYEMLEIDASLGYGINPRLLVGMGFDFRNYFKGGMDRFIQGFHDTFKISQNGRSEVPHNQIKIVFYDEAQNVMVDSDGVDDLWNAGIRFFTRYILYHGTDRWPAVGIAGTLRYVVTMPGGEGDDEPIDFGVSLGLSKRWGDRWYTSFSGGLTYYGQGQFLILELDHTLLSAMFGLEWRWRPNFSLLAQYQVTEGAVQNFSKLNDASHEATFGVKWQPASDAVIELALIENVINYDNSPDFGIHLAYTYLF